MSRIQTNIVLQQASPGSHPDTHQSASPFKPIEKQIRKLQISPADPRSKNTLKQSPLAEPNEQDFNTRYPGSSQSKREKENYREFDKPYIRFSRFEDWHIVQNLTQFVENCRKQTKFWGDDDSEFNEQYDLSGRCNLNFKLFPFLQLDDKSQQMNPKLAQFLIKKSQKILKPKQTGLRKLSGKAFKIVRELGQATYKDVASRLIKEVIQDESYGQGSGENQKEGQKDKDRQKEKVDAKNQQKQQNNIKRRVYDALNVLIAMGILKKIGKNIAYEAGSNGQTFTIAHKQQKQRLIMQLQTKKKQLIKKRESKKILITKIRILNHLMTRNRQIRQNEQKMPRQQQGKKILFPFCCVTVPKMKQNSQHHPDFIYPNSSLISIKLRPNCQIINDFQAIYRLLADKVIY